MMTFKVGDIVVPNIDAGWSARLTNVRHIVTKVPTRANEKNLVAAPCDGTGKQIPGRGLRGPDDAFLPYDPDAPVKVNAVNHPVGSVVRPNSSTIPAGLYVVIGETDATRVRIMRVGGDRGRYWRVPSQALTVLDPSAVEAALVNL